MHIQLPQPKQQVKDLLSKRSAIIASAIILATCGCSSGGGGQSSSDTEVTIPPLETSQDTGQSLDNSRPPWNSFQQQPQDPENLDQLASNFETDEYNAMGALQLIHASSAYARGATGAGVQVGIIDSGVYEQHIEFAQTQAGLAGDKVDYAGSDYSATNPRSNSAISHGTVVAGVIAANRDEPASSPNTNTGNNGASNGINMHGVAFDASLLVYEIPLGSSDAPYNPINVDDITFGDDNYFANRFAAMANQVDIINLSFGFPGVITSYSKAQIQSAFSLSLNALRQSNRARGERAIFVVAAGNAWNDVDDSGNPVAADSPELLPGLPYLFPELKDHMLAVAAVDNSGKIAFYSNRCGVAADFCLAAPGGGDGNDNGIVETGERIWGPTSPNDSAEANTYYYAGAIGTSFAAPLVSGSLALLKQMFPTVGNHELVSRLLTTANKTGIYADTSIYGQGLLDLHAATSPVGALAVASGSNLSDGLSNLNASTINTSPGGLGSSLLSALEGETLALFDQQGFPFYSDASVLIHQTRRMISTQLQHRQQRFENGAQLQLGLARSILGDSDSSIPAQQSDLQPGYLAFQFNSQSGGQRFIGVNTNPGWFFGLYADNLVSPASSPEGNRFAAPWLSFARNGWSAGGAMAVGSGNLRLGLFEGSPVDRLLVSDRQHNSHGGLFEYSFSGALFSGLNANADFNLNIMGGFIREVSSLLGSSLGEALGQFTNNATRFAGISGRLQLNNNWQGIFALYRGITESGSDNSEQNRYRLLNLDRSLSSNAWSLGFNHSPQWNKDDQLSITVHQPLRIGSGHGNLRIASGRTIDRQVSYKTIDFDLQPHGREQQFELRYQFKWARPLKWRGREFQTGEFISAARINYIVQPDHNPLAPDYAVIEFSLFKPLTR